MGERPLTIGIGGAHSNCGKTTVAVALLKALTAGTSPVAGTGHRPLITHHCSLITPRRWGAIKYTKTFLYASVTDDREILCEKGKDTARILEAGAEEVLWVRSSPSDITEVLTLAVERLSHLGGILVEGNGAIEFLSPDIVIFITGSARKGIKPSALLTLKRANILVVPEGSEASFDSGPGEPLVLRTGRIQQGLDEGFARQLISAMESILQTDRIERLLKERSAGGGITCEAARRIAEELSVPYSEVGKTANALKIKIRECDLGCF